MGTQGERCVWHHIDQPVGSRLHREWREVVIAAARRFGYEGVAADVAPGRHFTPTGARSVSVFTLSAPNAAVVRSMVEELPIGCGPQACQRRLVEADPGMLRMLRESIPDSEVVALELLNLDSELDDLLSRTADGSGRQAAGG